MVVFCYPARRPQAYVHCTVEFVHTSMIRLIELIKKQISSEKLKNYWKVFLQIIIYNQNVNLLGYLPTF